MISEFNYLRKNYPSFSFNHIPGKANKNHTLIAIEAANIKPDNYDIDIINKHKAYVTWNRKFVELNKDKIKVPIHIINGFPLLDYNHDINTWCTHYEDKTNGVCLIARIRNGKGVGDITNKRTEAMTKIDYPHKAVYGKNAWGGDMYKGVIGENVEDTWPSSIAKLSILSSYKFSVCFENCYDPIWSQDYITEKIFDCFKAKTVPIYYGCYNIEEHIPLNCFIDFRDFEDYNDLSEYLKIFSKDKYCRMVEDAYIFQKNCSLGNVDDFSDVLKNV